MKRFLHAKSRYIAQNSGGGGYDLLSAEGNRTGWSIPSAIVEDSQDWIEVPTDHLKHTEI